jgi:mannitol-1-phosphate/altronate dehydrogenase
MTIWKLLPNQPYQQAQVVWRKLEDGTEESCLVTAEEYLKWVAEGNEPLPPDSQE